MTSTWQHKRSIFHHDSSTTFQQSSHFPTNQKRRQHRPQPQQQQRWYIVVFGRMQQCIRDRCGNCVVVPEFVRQLRYSITRSTRWIVLLLLVTAVVLMILFVVRYITSPSISQVSYTSHQLSGGMEVIHTMLSTANTVQVVPYPKCAPWLVNTAQRTVAFLDLSDMDNYYNTKKKMYRGGEFYMSASLDYALRENGFIVKRIGMKSILQELQQNEHDQEKVLRKMASKYYRIFVNGFDPLVRLHNVSSLQHQPELTCKLRSIHWWGNTNEHYIPTMTTTLSSKGAVTNISHHPTPTSSSSSQDDVVSIDQLLPMLHHTQWMKPYPTADYHNTFIGYTPHSTILQPTYPNIPRKLPLQKPMTTLGRTRVGLLFGKYSKSFRQGKMIIDALIADGFTLHTSCTDCHDTTILPKEVIRHSSVGPLQFIQLLQNESYDISFLLGFGYPYDSPSPIEALVNGVAFINPISNHVSTPPNETATFPSYHSFYPLRASQHVPLQHLGIPYVYNVHLSNISQILVAANMAVQYRFHSYIPPEYHPLSLITRVCTVLLEDDTPCTCPLQKRHNDNIDCRPSSHTIRKSTTGNDANGVGAISFY